MSGPGTSGERLGAMAAWSSRAYRRFAAGFLGSSTSLQMLGVAALWEVYERTGSALMLGLVGLVRASPVIALALVAGHLADSWDRRRLLIGTQVGFAACAAGLSACAWAHAPLWVTFALLFLTGCCRAFNGPARNSLLPHLVPPRVLQNAITWNANLFQVAAISGPIIGGAIIYATGSAWAAYAVTALGTLSLAGAMTTVDVGPVAKAGDERRRLTDWGELFAGARHIRRERTVFGAITLDLLAVFFGGATALLPIFAKTVLAADAAALGEWLRGAAQWAAGAAGLEVRVPVLPAEALVLGLLRASPYVGALVMGLSLTRRHDFRRAGPVLLWSVAIYGVCTVAFGLSSSLWLSLAALAASGAADQISVVVRHVLVQTRTPDHLRGRVSAVNSVFIECSNELGSFEAGLVASLFGAVFSVVSGGISTVAVVAGVAAGVPELRALRELHPREEGEGPRG